MNDRKVTRHNHAARMFGISPAWLKEQIEAGLIPAVKANRIYLVLPDKVEAFLVQQAEQSYYGRKPKAHRKPTALSEGGLSHERP